MNAHADRRMGGALLVALIAAALLLPWLGDTLFNTKGEPREALVALSMVKSGNWVLPEVYGADIPYKPPLLAWLIAAASLLTGGVNVVAARLPSAIAAIGLVVATYFFFVHRRRNPRFATTVALVTLTATEVYRAAAVCRVDMVLTACMVGALYCMFERRESLGRPGFSWWAVLLMSGAVMTKGPVGALLPALAMAIYLLLRNDRPFAVVGWMALTVALSLILPALWYWLAWRQGGERFLGLALEENLGRLTGTMSYGSHNNPWWYNVVTLAAGMLPYTLLAFFAALAAPWSRFRPAGLWSRLRALNAASLFSLTAAIVVFVFYCIPSSKRSVYLLPIYPFAAYGIALLAERGGWPRRLFACIVGAVALIVGWAVWGFHMVDGAAVIAGVSGEALDLMAGLFAEDFGFADWCFVCLCIAGGVASLWLSRGRRAFAAAIGATLSVYLLLGATVLPVVLNPKSDIVLARAVRRFAPDCRDVYTYNSAPLLRFYTADFYLGDSLRLFAPERLASQAIDKEQALPDSGLLIVGRRDLPLWRERFGDGYATDSLWSGTRRSCDSRDTPLILRFRATQ